MESRAAVDVVDVVYEHTKGREPGQGEDQVGRVVENRRSGRDHPDERENDGQSGNDHSVDLASMGTDVRLVVSVEEVGDDAEDDLKDITLLQRRGSSW